MEYLLAPFQFPFMVKAALIVAIIAIPAAMLSCFLVLKGWSLMGDAVSHAVLPGVVLAYMLNIPLIVGAFAAGMVCAVSTGFIQENSRVKRDTVLGVVMSGMFGLGVLMYTQVQSSVHLDHILFGNMLGIGWDDLAISAAISAAVGLVLVAQWRDQALLAFDPVQARVSGLRVGWLHYGMLAMLSAMVVAMLTSVGIVLSIGILIAPGAIAFLLTRRLPAMLALASVVAMASGLGGVIASFWLDASPAATIILILTVLFIAAFLWRQWVARRIAARALDLDARHP